MNQVIEQSLVNWAAVLSFLLSLVLTIREVIKSRIKISVNNANYQSFYMHGKVVACLRLIVSNDSLCPVSLTSVAFLNEKGKKYPGDFDSNLFLGAGKKTEEARLRSTQFPINLGPRESRQLNLMFHFTNSDSEELHLPLADSVPGEENILSIPGQPMANLPYRLRFSIHRRSVVVSGNATVCDVEDTLAKLQAVNDRAISG